MPRIGRAENGRRAYEKRDLDRVALIRRCRDFGMGIGQVRELIAAIDGGPPDCAGARDLALAHVATLREKRIELRKLETALLGLAETCQPGCTTPGEDGCCVVEGFKVSPT